MVFSFHEASKSIYTAQIQAVDNLVSVHVAENSAQDVAGNTNLPSDRLEVRHCKGIITTCSLRSKIHTPFVLKKGKP